MNGNAVFIFLLCTCLAGCGVSQKSILYVERSGPLVGLHVTAETPASPARGKIPLVFRISRRNPVRLGAWLEYSVDGGAVFHRATVSGSRDDAMPLMVDAFEQKREIIWDSVADGVGVYGPFTSVMLRLKIAIHSGGMFYYPQTERGVPVIETARFVVDNSGPVSRLYETGFSEKSVPAWIRVTAPELIEAGKRDPSHKWLNVLLRRGVLTISGGGESLLSPGIPSAAGSCYFFEFLPALKKEGRFTVRLRTRLEKIPMSGTVCLIGMTQSGGWKNYRLMQGPYEQDRMRLDLEEGEIRFRYRNGSGNWTLARTGPPGAESEDAPSGFRADRAGIAGGAWFDIVMESDGKSWRLSVCRENAVAVTAKVKWSDTFDNGTSYRCWWGLDRVSADGFRVSYDSFRCEAGENGR